MRTLTAAADRELDFVRAIGVDAYSRAELRQLRVSDAVVDARLAARRWQRVGRAIVLHNGPPSRAELWRAAALNCGPRAVLASFTAAESAGLRGWEREEIHVLAPAGVANPRVRGLPLVLHRTVLPIRASAGRTVQALPDALILAASSFRGARPACGLLAAGVQQRLTTARQLRNAVDRSMQVRHHAALRHAVGDIAMGAESMAEIDFARLCRRHGLPEPVRQSVRRQRDGKRRYLDVEWVLRDGRRVVVEVDGALHLEVQRWHDDQLRQNAVVLDGALVLRYPSVVVRTEENLVVDQLRRALADGS